MKKLLLLIALACMVILAPAAARAGCTVIKDGVKYSDSDCDGVIDYSDMNDYNHDGLPDGDPVDNCPNVRNGNCDTDPLNCDIDGDGRATEKEILAGNQMDWNDNGDGDACDDTDRDGIPDWRDNCRATYNPDQDPKACVDTDHDGFEDPIDNCPTAYNPLQEDTDGDGIGDVCDNCLSVANPDQKDSVGDKIGDACRTAKPATQPAIAAQPSTNPTLGPQTVPGEHIQGNGAGGGCSLLVASAVPLPWAAMGFLAAAALALLRRKE
ncbi:MAG: thrombospondin type 3 repeat-containing protein [Pseudomonadota bacterium]